MKMLMEDLKDQKIFFGSKADTKMLLYKGRINSLYFGYVVLISFLATRIFLC